MPTGFPGTTDTTFTPESAPGPSRHEERSAEKRPQGNLTIVTEGDLHRLDGGGHGEGSPRGPGIEIEHLIRVRGWRFEGNGVEFDSQIHGTLTS